MPKFRDRQLIHHPRPMVYGIAKDVAQYPQFLPWCTGARLFAQKDLGAGEGQFDADLVIGFRMFRERFTSRVVYKDHESVDAEYIKGPMRYCKNQWRFEETSDGATMVDFFVDFEFANRLLQATVEDMFMAASQKMIKAFKERADDLAGVTRPKSKPRVTSSSPFLQMLDARRRD